MKSSGHVRECYSCRCTFTDDRRFYNSSAPKVGIINFLFHDFVNPELQNSYLQALAFYGSSLNLTDLPLPRNAQTWALLHEESPRNNPHLLSAAVLSLFNFSSTFSRHSHAPLTLLYVDRMSDIRGWYNAVSYVHELEFLTSALAFQIQNISFQRRKRTRYASLWRQFYMYSPTATR